MRMKGLVRALLAAIGVLGILVVVAVVYITTFFDPNDLKPRLVQAVKQQSGLELHLDGPLSWSFYPRIGVSVQDAEAWLPSQTPDEAPFAGFDRAEVSVAFAPLLSGDVSIDGLILDGMRLNLSRDAQGQGNWQQLLDNLADGDAGTAEAETAAKETTPAEDESDAAPSQPVAFDIASVQVSNSQVRYVDRQQGLDLTLANLDLKSSNVSPQSSFPVQLSFDIDGAEPALSGRLQFKSQMRMALADGRYTFEGVTLDGRAQLPNLAEQAQTANLKIATLVADTQAAQYRADGIDLKTSLYHPQLQEAPLSLALAANASVDLAAGTAALNDMALSGDNGLDLSGEVDVSALGADPQFQGQLALAPLSVRDWLVRVGVAPNTADDSALTSLSLHGPFTGDAQRIDFNELQLTLDDTAFTGSLGARFDGQALDFDLAGDALDLDAYLPPAPAASDDAAQGGEAQTAWLEALGVAPALAASEGAELLPVDWLAGLEQEGQLTLESLKAKGLSLSNVSLTTSGSGGRQRVDSLSADLYEGSLRASSALDLRQAPIRLSFTERLQGVQIAPLYQAASGKTSPLRGTLNLQGDFDSRTNTLDGLKQHLNGQAALRVDNGAMLDVNVSRQLCTAAATLEGRESTREWSDDTAFDRLRASVTVADGVAHNEDLTIAIPGIEVTGSGDVNLVTNRIDYRAAARFVDTADQAACRVNPRLAQVDFPIRCQGRLDGAPGEWCGFDREAFQRSLGELAASEARRKAGERVDEALDERLDDDTRRKIDERLGDGAAEELGNKLRGLFQ
ncbi:AsmA family protein [Salinicola avicenniae]|uniref:AsmA family protein n=1 Tax=Salinicola avicenniae TaxID=2916836 RepID=UPI002072F4F6|nr:MULTISPECIES: AsmA family protein [unclassified Salinicola]